MSNFLNIPEYKSVTPEINLRDPDEVTNSILSFMQSQSNVAQKQFKTSRNLIVATILIMLFQIGNSIYINSKSSLKQNNLTKLFETQLKQSETISQMSLSLLYLRNQVSTLEKEKKELLKK